jgi:pimeloyl-ACP methyl ester carboxylesterase
MAATTNPLHDTHVEHPAPTISTQTHTIAGILCTIHGLTELPPSTTSVTCLWLLHPRLQTAQKMAPLAAQLIHHQNSRIAENRAGKRPRGLIAVSFDQRNHGTREVDKLHNEAWRQGNPTHAQDMFGCFHGTALDTSQLMTHLESYILNEEGGARIEQHFVLGISLGGHAAWHCILSDPRITAAVVGIGCPDYTRLMADRARLSKLDSWTKSDPPGKEFLGSKDFPLALRKAVARYDPAGLLLPNVYDPTGSDAEVGKATLDRFRVLVRERLHGKHILNLSGQEDKLVPYAAGGPFLKVFKEVLKQDPSLDVGFEDVLFDGVGHAFPHSMAEKASEWICDLLAREEAPVSSKI